MNGLAKRTSATEGDEAPQRISQTYASLHQLGNAVELLEKQLTDLRRRLEPVIPARPETAGKDVRGPVKDVLMADLPQKISCVACNVERMNHAVSEILSNLEL